MPMGPGKYDEACTVFRHATQAAGVMVVVFGGSNGNGFSCQLPPEIVPTIPAILRSIADEIDKSIAAGGTA